jgi:hypothetical protein
MLVATRQLVNNINLFLIVLEPVKTKIKALVELGSGED